MRNLSSIIEMISSENQVNSPIFSSDSKISLQKKKESYERLQMKVEILSLRHLKLRKKESKKIS
jgi:hypothetical protein